MHKRLGMLFIVGSAVLWGIGLGIALALVYYVLLLLTGTTVPVLHALISGLAFGCLLGGINGMVLALFTNIIRDPRHAARAIYGTLAIMVPLYLITFLLISPTLAHHLFLMGIALFASVYASRVVVSRYFAGRYAEAKDGE